MLHAIFLFICGLGFIIGETSSWEIDDYGGHSREFRSLQDTLDWDSLSRSHFPKQRRAAISARNTDDEIRNFIQSHRPAHEFLKKYFLKKFSNEWLNVSSRVKAFDSLKTKLIKKNYTVNDINDVVGFRFTLPTVSDVRRLQHDFEKDTQGGFRIIEKICYGICSEANQNYRDGGYRRIHFVIQLPAYNNRTVELQLGTPYTNFWSDWTHDFSYKGELGDNQDVKAYLADIGEYLYQLDETRDHLPKCPAILYNEKSIEIPGQQHTPPNLCYNWVDIDLIGIIPRLASESPRNTASNISNAGLLLVLITTILILKIYLEKL